MRFFLLDPAIHGHFNPPHILITEQGSSPVTVGRFALAALLIACGLNPARSSTQAAYISSRDDAAAQTDLLPPPAPLPSSLPMPGAATPISNLRRADFARTLWLNAFDPALHTAEGVRKAVQYARKAAFNTLCVSVRRNGVSACTSPLTPRHDSIPADFDPLATLLAEASGNQSASPLKVIAALDLAHVGSAKGSGAAMHVASLHPEWLSAADNSWLEPAIPEVRQHLVEITRDLAARYPVDGIVLENPAYSGSLESGSHPRAIQRFVQETGVKGNPGSADPVWIEWRRRQAAATVTAIRKAARTARPQLSVSLLVPAEGAAPGDLPTWLHNAELIGQPLNPWPVLAEQGQIDALMLTSPADASISEEGAALEAWTRFASQNKGSARLVVGVIAREKEMRYTAALMLDPILDPRADGVALLPGTNSPTRIPAAVYSQLFDPSLVEAQARAQLPTPSPLQAQSAGAPALSPVVPLTLHNPPLPSSGSFLQMADPAAPTPLPPVPAADLPPLPPANAAGPGTLPPMATPAPLGNEAAAVPPLSPPAAVPPPAPPAAPAAAPAATPAVAQEPLPPGPDTAADALPPLPPLSPLPGADSPPPAPAAEPPSLSGATAAPPPLPSEPAPLDSMPPLVPVEDGSSAAAAAAPVPRLPGVPERVISDRTNWTGAPMAGPLSVAPPLMTPLTIAPPPPAVVTQPLPVPYGKEAVPIAAPQMAIPDFSDPNSPFVPRVPPPVMRNYGPPSFRAGDVSPSLPPEALEVIILTSGKEVVGRVVERGPENYRIQLPNGGIIAMDARRILTVRTQPQPLDVRPLTLPPVAP